MQIFSNQQRMDMEKELNELYAKTHNTQLIKGGQGRTTDELTKVTWQLVIMLLLFLSLILIMLTAGCALPALIGL